MDLYIGKVEYNSEQVLGKELKKIYKMCTSYHNCFIYIALYTVNEVTKPCIFTTRTACLVYASTTQLRYIVLCPKIKTYANITLQIISRHFTASHMHTGIYNVKSFITSHS